MRINLLFITTLDFFPFSYSAYSKNMKREKNKVGKSVERKLNEMGYLLVKKSDVERIREKYIMIGMEMYFKKYMEEN